MAGKVRRLSKVARELNVGISTIVDYLGSQDVAIDSSPNTKLDENHYEMLSEQFAADQNLKEQSKKTALTREKRETISLKDNNKKEEEVIEEETVQETPAPEKTEEAPAKEEAKPEPVVEEKKEEVVEAPVAKEEPKEEVKAEPKEEPKQEKKAEPVKDSKPEEEKKSQGDGGVNVVGKIDLSTINTKTRPDKKGKPSREDKKASDKVVRAKLDAEKQKEAKSAAEAKAKAEASKPAEKKQEVETIRAESKKLSGPTVVGKIVLPVEKPKSSKKDEPKRKRKRIKKVDVNKSSNQGGRKPGQHSPNYKGNKGKKGGPKPEITEKDIQKEIKETLARLSGGGKSKGAKNRRAKRDSDARKREKEEMAAELEQGVLKLTEFVTVSELASMMNISSTQVISACMSLGIFASINQRLDAETITIVAEEFGYEVEFVSAEVQEAIPVVEDKPEDLETRPAIITVMGHVDHGKTSLLDYIRNANIVDGEAGGITQHIGAYSVVRPDGRKLTFLDTPGHEAFTAMRARGAQVTDVAIIIVAADDDVMPQTKEAISHAQAAGVPMIFAINKIDKPGANPDKVKEQLSAMNILVEEWGGKYQSQDISAKKGLHIDELLEKVILEADLLDLKANPNKAALGTVIESSLDKGKGFITNLIVEAGTMKIGDIILAGRHSGRVRAMHNEHGKSLESAGPATPVSILGITGAPSAGDKFHIMEDEKEARAIATKREQLYREQGLRTQKHITLDEIGRRLAIGDFKELNVIVKGDVDGSIEALSDSLLKLSTEEIQVNIVHKAVGAITEADINLASASDAVIIGFQVRPTMQARQLAETEQIDIRLYSVIYKAIEELKDAMEGMLSPDIKEEIIGTAEVRDVFKITKVGTIAGCYVTSGVIKRSSKVRLLRDNIVIYEGLLGSLKRFKDDVKEVKNNYECGLNIDKYNNIEVGDVVEAYEEVEVARKLK